MLSAGYGCCDSDRRACKPTPTMTSPDAPTDAAAIQHLGVLPTILQVLRRTTDLRVALVVRVTEHAWTACAVLDEAGLGLAPGDQVELSTTY